MGLIGGILGDIAGSKYEFTKTHPPYEKEKDLVWDGSLNFTDDTIMAIAVADALNNHLDFEEAYIKWGKKYPDAGYGGRFRGWLFADTMFYDKEIYDKMHPEGIPKRKPYNSYGNGSAMRSVYIGEFLKRELNQRVVEEMAEKSAICTHNHPEGIKGAVVESVCVWYAEQGKSKDYILNYGIEQYPCSKYKFGCDVSTELYREKMVYHVSCQNSVPVAIRCFYDTNSFTECMNLINSMECDTDTIGAMAGAICHSYYGKCTDNDIDILTQYLNEDMLNIIENKS